MPLIGDFVDLIAPVAPSTLGAEVFERFQNEPNTLALAVVDDQGRPLGVIERNAFTLRMAAEFGRALYARKPAESLMDRNAPVAEASASAETFFDAYDAAELGALLSGFIVVSNGRYVGVGTALLAGPQLLTGRYGTEFALIVEGGGTDAAATLDRILAAHADPVVTIATRGLDTFDPETRERVLRLAWDVVP